MKWIVLIGRGLHYEVFGPIVADNAHQACDDLARGTAQLVSFYGSETVYGPQGRGRYFAVPLDTWQDGAFDFTEKRGTEALFSGS